MSQPTAVLIVTGAWHVPAHYQKLRDALESRGVRTICETLPTNNNAVPPTATLHDDITFLRTLVAKEAAAGTRLTVLAHSWGGVVSSGALADLAVSSPGGGGGGGVADLVFMCAFVPREGESLTGMLGGTNPPYLVDDAGVLRWRNPIEHLYNDLEPAEAARAESLRVAAHGTAAQATPIDAGRKAAWRAIPTTYIFCEEDQALPLAVQEVMVRRVERDGVAVRRFSLKASHSPFLSMPDKVADIVLEVKGKGPE
ncbi:hypothetical protein ISF_02630 [Cordyceps fumosorosea ARSEF 2679]|uniref:AB hydrolase-1 domain-containing protein n=1 Tax=Cordyceps fumosorosea (strain ARSEF 2679) TaxID=1081104 RepID=A0A168BX21_CORFA|nr:hypothetical protein ISF_02630 [Cordyceps fumosorosea ARSEF 2679]OAA70656.1 hypothetical protein ISF_02630 [Cordyceps fumosorosea ARSEF 2679]